MHMCNVTLEQYHMPLYKASESGDLSKTPVSVDNYNIIILLL